MPFRVFPLCSNVNHKLKQYTLENKDKWINFHPKPGLTKSHSPLPRTNEFNGGRSGILNVFYQQQSLSV